MGDADITQLFNSTNNWDSIFTKYGGVAPSEDIVSVYHDESQGGYYYKILRNTASTEWHIVYAWSGGGNRQSNANPSYGMAVKLNDGNYYTFYAELDDSLLPPKNSRYRYGKLTSRPTISNSNNPDGLDVSAETTQVTEGSWQWGILKFKTNGNVDLYGKVNDGLITGSPNSTIDEILVSMTLIDSDIMTWSGAKIEEIVMFANVLNTTNGYVSHLNTLRVEADEATAEGGTADLTNLININTTTKIGGGGGANLIMGYNNSDELAVLEANLGKSITIQDTTYGNYMFKGEIKSMRKTRKNVTYRVEEGIRKLTKQFANTNPVLYRSEVQKTLNNIIYDEFAGWSVNAYQNKLLFTEDADLRNGIFFPLTVTPYLADEESLNDNWVQTTPDNQGGSVEYLYYFENEEVNDVYGIHYLNEVGGGGTDDTPGMQFIVKVWYKENTSWSDMKLKLDVRFTSLKGSKVEGAGGTGELDFFPRLGLYSTISTDYKELERFTNDRYSNSNVEDTEEWHTASIEAADGSAGKSPIISVELSVLESGQNPNHFLTNVSAPNANGFVSAEILIRLKGASVSENVIGVPDKDPKMEVHYLHVEMVNADRNQGQELSAGFIASNTAKQITLDGTKAWELSNFPSADGVVTSDKFFISEPISTILTEIFANANTNFTVDTDFNNDYSEFGESEDLTHTYIYEYLQKITGQFNWLFWYAPTSVTDVVKVADNTISTGITLTINDILNYNEDGFSVNVDINNIRTKIVGIGDEGITHVDNDGVDYNVDVNFTLGDEEIIYRDNELYSQRNVDQYVQSKQNVNKSKSVSIEVRLDYLDPYQNYQNIALGKTIAVEIPEFSSAAEGFELMVESITYISDEANGWSEEVILQLQRRVV
jgi:hypothetical protein